jgi:hypothetical protein
MRTVVERESNMKVLVFATVVLGLTVFFGSFEPTFASSAPVTSDSVSVASEEIVEATADQMASRNKNGNKRIRTGANAGAGNFTGADW